MKKYFISLALVAFAILVSCNKEEVNTTTDTTAQTEFITVELNPQTKTSLSGVNTQWEDGDKVSVTVNGEVIGTLNYVEGSTFTGEIEAGHDGAAEVLLHYPAGVNEVPVTQDAVAGSFANGAALLDGTTTIADLRAGIAARLTNKTALLKFSVAQAGNVTFEMGATTYTVNGCETGNTYYLCVNPVSDVNLVARIGGYLSNATTKTVNFAANKIANLGTLPAPKATTVELRGAAPLNWDSGAKFYSDLNGYSVLKNVSLSANQEFKFIDGSAWIAPISTETGAWMRLYENVGNMKVASAGFYDIYVSESKKSAYITTAGSAAPELVLPQNNYVYLQPSLNWLEANAKFVAWVWKDSGAGTAYNFKESKVKGIYELNVSGKNKMIIIRMDPSTEIKDGSTSWPGDGWAKTGDLTIIGNLYTVVNWHASGSGFSTISTLL